jgi:streptogramin lyase
MAAGGVQASIAVTVTNTGTHAFDVQPDDFTLSAEGDTFGQGDAPRSMGTLIGTVDPGVSRAGQLTFVVPRAALSYLALLYHPRGQSRVMSLPLAGSTTAPAAPLPIGSAIQEYPLSGGVGEPWGTAMDAAGNIWFAEPGCDFAPTCASSTPPGQIGELPAGSRTPRFFTLPPITGNQPIFVALDRAGKVWFTTPNNSMIGEFNPTSQSFVGQWAVAPGSSPWDLTFANGKIWYTEHLVSAVGAFDPRTHTHTDFMTPTNNSNPYGIAASDSLIWFTENNSSVARIAMLDTSENDQISEYLIRQQLPGGAGLTPHMIRVDADGHPWWTEGWVRAIGTLDPDVATPGQCGTVSSAGDCTGVTELPLPAPPSTCPSSHVSGLAVQGDSSRIWLDDSLSNQVGVYNAATNQFTLDNLSCGVHPHDGLNLEPTLHVWWDEEFNNALGELTHRRHGPNNALEPNVL